MFVFVENSLAGRKKVKNLEQEVEMILSQDESDEEIVQSKANPITPKNKKTALPETPTVAKIPEDSIQTPRRSVRRSIKPPQDYEEIVASGKKRLRSASRGRKQLQELQEDPVKEEETTQPEKEEEQPQQPKWTPAKVGRVSQKRGRKGRKSQKQLKMTEDKANAEVLDVEVSKVVACPDYSPEVVKKEEEKLEKIVKSDSVVSSSQETENSSKTVEDSSIISADIISNVVTEAETVISSTEESTEIVELLDNTINEPNSSLVTSITQNNEVKNLNGTFQNAPKTVTEAETGISLAEETMDVVELLDNSVNEPNFTEDVAEIKSNEVDNLDGTFELTKDTSPEADTSDSVILLSPEKDTIINASSTRYVLNNF